MKASNSPKIDIRTRFRIIWYFSVPRTWLFALLGFHFGYFIASKGDVFNWKLWIGDLLMGPFGTGATNFINMIYDQIEDSLNKPVRTNYIKFVTSTDLHLLTWLFYAISLLLSFLYRDWRVIFLILLSIFISHQYSAPPLRFKKHYLTNNTSLAFGSCIIPFITGWFAAGESFYSLPFSFLFFEFIFVNITLISKDVPDIEGDRLASLLTIPTITGFLSLWYYYLLLFIPPLLVFFMVIINWLPLIMIIWGCLSVIALTYILLIAVPPTRLLKEKSKQVDRAIHFVYIFTYTQIMRCLLYSFEDPSIPLNWTFLIYTSVIMIIFIFTSGYLSPTTATSLIAAAPKQFGG